MIRFFYILLIAISFNIKIVLGAASSSTPKEVVPLTEEIISIVTTQEFHEGTVSSEIYENAVNLLNDFIKKVDNNANAYNWLGFSYRQLEQYNKAFDPYNKALAVDKKHLGANEYLGELYLKINKPKKAKKYLKKLAKYCEKKCEEYLELKEKIESYELNNSS